LRYHSPEEWQLVLEEDANINLSDQFIQSILLNTSTELLKENIKMHRPSATKAGTKLKQIYNVQKVKNKALSIPLPHNVTIYDRKRHSIK
jgi:hypothetical protein